MRHGADLYKQTVNLKNNPPPPVPAPETEPVFVRKTKSSGVPAGISGAKTNNTDDNVHESKYRRVAKFLILIGSEQASEILAELDPDQVEKISKESA
jgi:hypothetical protein